MNKKKIIFSLLVILVLAPTFIVITNIANKKNETKTQNDYEKSKQIEEFVNKQKGKDPNKEIDTNEGGYSGVLLNNKQSLLRVMNADGMLSVDNMIKEGLKYIPQIHEDSMSLTGDAINEYYLKNKDKISSTFGITDVETFSIFLSDLNFIGEGKINEASIDESTVKKGEFKEGEVRFDLTLKSTIGKEQKFNIKFLIQENNQKDSRLIYWY